MRETKINKERDELLLNLKKAMEYNCAAEKGLYEIEDKLELEYVKLPHFFNQPGIWIILYLLHDYSIPKQSLSFLIIY